jgi:hypothetical protein
VRLLAQQVLDLQDVGQGKVAIVAQELLGQRLPTDHAAAVDLADVAQLMWPRGLAQVPGQSGREQDQA